MDDSMNAHDADVAGGIDAAVGSADTAASPSQPERPVASAGAARPPRGRRSPVRGLTERQLRRRIVICRVIQWVLLPVMLALVWVVVGLAMRAGIAPFFDLGYLWFDQHVFPLFGLL